VQFDEQSIDAIFAELDRCHLPGAAIGISIAGRPVYRKAFGLASMELPVALATSTRMRIASGSKHFTALAYLLLCERGEAALDDPIGQYLPELHPVTHAVTPRQLMGHLGGLYDVHDICWQFSGRGSQVSSEQLLGLHRDCNGMNAAPGSTWLYSNGGYLMLTAAIERIAGCSLEEFLRERIFEPVGMHDTLLCRFDNDFVPNRASLHRAKSDPTHDSTIVKIARPEAGFEKAQATTAWAGEGGIVSTVDDLLRWLAHMDAPVVGSAETWETIKKSQVLTNGTSTGYGLGLMRGRYRGLEILHHAGGVTGGNSYLLKVPAAGLDVAILLNRDDVIGVLLVQKILDACFADLAPIEQSARRPCIEGTFHSAQRCFVVQLFAKEDQQMASINGLDLPVIGDEHGVLRPAGIFTYLQQSIAPLGDPACPEAIEFRDFGNLEVLVRLSPERTLDPVALEGCYRSDAIGTDVSISSGREGLELTTFGRFGSAHFRLEALGEGTWRARSTDPSMAWTGGVLSFDSQAGSFRFSAPRTWNVLFRRCG
jgi:CubicO group peptidase (beta-lactamase class C family)